MATSLKVYKNGNEYGAEYTFEFPNEGFQMHDHPAGQEHNIICLQGKVLVYGGGWQKLLNIGEIYETIAGTRHEVAALEANTVIRNLYLDNQPQNHPQWDPAIEYRIPTEIVSPPTIV